MRFNYQARDNNGQVQIGLVEASSKETALQILSRYGLYVTLLEPEARPLYAKRIEIFEKISRKDIMLFSRQLAVMLQSQIPLVEALQALGKQLKKRILQEKIFKISEAIEGGTSLSEALSLHPGFFSPFYISMVKSGETSGKLAGSFGYLAEHLEREYLLMSKIRGALVYPAFVVFMGFAVIFLLMTFVIPNLAQVFESSKAQLPFLTKIVIGSADFSRQWWWLMILLIVGMGIFLFRFARVKEGSRILSRVFLTIPLLSSVTKMIYLSRIAENLSTLIAGGVPIVRALEIARDIIGNEVYKKILGETNAAVRRGDKISFILEKYPSEFPPIFVQMVAVGERTGNLDDTLQNMSNFYQQEATRTVDSLLTLLEPALIVFLGLVVGGLMASILLPLYQLLSFES